MSSLKMFSFHVENHVTKEIASFAGQGTSLEEAWKDAIAGVTSKFRPDSNGGGEIRRLAVRTPEGLNVSRLKEEFEGESPFAAPEEDCPM